MQTLNSILDDKIINSKSDPACNEKTDSKEDFDKCVYVWLAPHILDAPDAAYKADNPKNKRHN